VSPEVAFDLDLEHGRCLGVRLDGPPDALDPLAREALPPEEQAFGQRLAPLRRRTWIGGRIALRLALARCGMEAPAVLADDRGAPLAPSGIAVSISHKERIAVALVAKTAARIGVDVEVDAARGLDIAPRVLLDDEAVELAGLDAAARAREVLLRFSAKEAVYKALDPFVRRFVAFREVAVTPQPDGGARVRLALSEGEGPFAVEVRWLRLDGLVLTTAASRVVRLGAIGLWGPGPNGMLRAAAVQIATAGELEGSGRAPLEQDRTRRSAVERCASAQCSTGS
jgi:4'-phosphopantetheinyl transferase EntD